jgi:hypothetical protein
MVDDVRGISKAKKILYILFMIAANGSYFRKKIQK